MCLQSLGPHFPVQPFVFRRPGWLPSVQNPKISNHSAPNGRQQSNIGSTRSFDIYALFNNLQKKSIKSLIFAGQGDMELFPIFVKSSDMEDIENTRELGIRSSVARYSVHKGDMAVVVEACFIEHLIDVGIASCK